MPGKNMEIWLKIENDTISHSITNSSGLIYSVTCSILPHPSPKYVRLLYQLCKALDLEQQSSTSYQKFTKTGLFPWIVDLYHIFCVSITIGIHIMCRVCTEVPSRTVHTDAAAPFRKKVKKKRRRKNERIYLCNHRSRRNPCKTSNYVSKESGKDLSPILTLRQKEKKVNAKGVLGVMGLGAKRSRDYSNCRWWRWRNRSSRAWNIFKREPVRSISFWKAQRNGY